jgi:hypothetical protein
VRFEQFLGLLELALRSKKLCFLKDKALARGAGSQCLLSDL